MRVIIRPLKVEDALISYMWRNDSQIWRYTGSKPDMFITPEIETEWIKKVISNKNEYRCAIEVDDVYIGNIYLTDINSESCDYHIFIGDKSYWGKGVAKKASLLIIEYSFKQLKLSKIFLSLKKTNESAHNLYKSLGFSTYDERDGVVYMVLCNPIIFKAPIVSVCMITYNHELYIREAIEGVLMQKTSFPIELIISEDCSTDNTRKIVSEYAEKYPEIIVADLPDKNRGATDNFIHCVSVSSGKYIALCEGDDYWTDPLKLQRQVDFLESNPSYSAVAENGLVVNTITSKEYVFSCESERDVSVEELIMARRFPTASVVFRKQFADSLIKENPKVMYDTLMWSYLCSKGKFRYFTNVSLVYRRGMQGVVESTDKYKWAKTVESWNLELKKLFVPKYVRKEVIDNNIWYHYRALIHGNRNYKSSFTRKVQIVYTMIKYRPMPTLKFLVKKLLRK